MGFASLSPLPLHYDLEHLWPSKCVTIALLSHQATLLAHPDEIMLSCGPSISTLEMAPIVF